MKTILLSLSLLLSSPILTSQTKPADQQEGLDSLYQIWEDPEQPKSARVKAYRDYLWEGIGKSNPDSANLLAQNLHQFAEEHDYPKAAAYGFSVQAALHWRKRDYPASLKYHHKCLSMMREIGDSLYTANTLYYLGIAHYSAGNYDSALVYFNKSLRESELLAHDRNKISSLHYLGEIHNRQANYKSALVSYQSVLDLSQDSSRIANVLGSIGVIFIWQGNYLEALKYQQKSLNIQQALNNKSGIAGSLNSLGIIYHELKDYQSALDYYQRSLAIFKELESKAGIAQEWENIGLVYQELGKLDLALQYNEKSLAVAKELGRKTTTAISLNNMANVFQLKGDYLTALAYYQQSLDLYEEIGDQYGIADNLSQMGALYLKQGKTSLALKNCQDALAISEEIGTLDLQQQSCQCLYDTYKNLGQSTAALRYLERLNSLQDSLRGEETTKELQQMEFAKEVYKDSVKAYNKELQMALAYQAEVRKEQQTRNWSIAGGAVFLMLAGGFYSRWRYVSKSKATIEREKSRSDNLLLNILPAEIAEELKQHGKSKARDFERVSILFTDFKEFTQTSEKLTAQELVEEINVCFKAFDQICDKYGIEKIKTIGDAYMAAGGLPLPTDDSAMKIVLASIEMQDFISQRKAKHDAKGEPAFEMRVGIHTGPVVAGIVGIKKFQYDIWGDTVNTASRMESAGEVGKVNISQTTYELLKDDPDFAFESRGKIEAKGKGLVEMYFVSLSP